MNRIIKRELEATARTFLKAAATVMAVYIATELLILWAQQ